MKYIIYKSQVIAFNIMEIGMLSLKINTLKNKQVIITALRIPMKIL